jgi:predicted DNA binding CopG/RHH family protein
MRDAAAERKLLRSFEKGEWRSALRSTQVLRKYQRHAQATLAKDRRVNIRLASVDVEAIRVRALEEGIPYQTLMASVLHKFVSGRLVEKPSARSAPAKRAGRRRAVA